MLTVFSLHLLQDPVKMNINRNHSNLYNVSQKCCIKELADLAHRW